MASQEDPSDMEYLLVAHLERSGLLSPQSQRAWSIAHSSISGRGLVATRDLLPGDLVLEDSPLVLAPRASSRSAPLCAACHRGAVPLGACAAGCGLPLCARCPSSPQHATDCRTLLGWRQGPALGGGWSPALLWALAAVRCLQLAAEDQCLLRCLLAHDGPQHAMEIEILKKEMDGGPGPTQEEVELMHLACQVMDANAFDTPGPHENASLDGWHLPTKERVSCLRGLYPVAAMMNHACSPNTRRGWSDQQRHLVVRAAVHVRAGEELTNSYTTLLWGTLARRRHLLATKHFLCRCARCRHPQEWGAKLSALACPRPHCSGSMLPEDPLQLCPTWQCDTCEAQLTSRQATAVQAALGRLLVSVDTSSPGDVHEFLASLGKVVPASNQVVVQLKCDLICQYGHRIGRLYKELSDGNLQEKLDLCKEILNVLATLRAGVCSLKGFICYEMACTLLEMRRRLEASGEVAEQQSKSLLLEASSALEQSALIFQADITAPADLWKLLDNARRQREATSPTTNGI